MEKLFFDYKMTINYSEVVNLCHFSYKCIPKDTARQKIIKYGISLDPLTMLSYCEDSFGNKKLYGTINRPHMFIELHMWGETQIEQILFEEPVNENMIGCFSYPFGNNIAGEKIKAYSGQLQSEEDYKYLKTCYEKAMYIMERLHKDFEYKKGVTSVATTAEEAFEKRCGVCQDIAHIYIALLHLEGIPARYVTGLIVGEGESHAWVEFAWRGNWVGVDPTNKLLVDNSYIKISSGRDSTDCEVNRGIMYGGGQQSQYIDVKVWRDKK